MCLILFAYNAHPEYKLVVAANRDEFYQRPTAKADFWDDDPHILAGRDLLGSGTWMGINRAGRLSMITNFRDLSNIKHEAPSRGRLVSEYLMQETPPKDYLFRLHKVRDIYNGYNLLIGNPDDLWYYSNVEGKVKQLGSGFYGLSNHLLNTPWPKVKKGIEGFRERVTDNRFHELQDLLYDDDMADDASLPDTGIGLEKERMLSPMFIKSPDYGTRTSTILTVSKDNKVDFHERTYNLSDFSYDEVTFNFMINE
jgi:uncharacterized protein with NRDE domain